MMIKNWIKHQFRKKTRIYIVPTKMGGYLNGLIFLMFLLSIGYSNNLLLIFTLFLFGFNLLWVIQTHFHLHHLKFAEVILTHGHAGVALPVRIKWPQSPQGPVNWSLTMETDNESVPMDILESTPENSYGEIRLPHRGKWSWKFLRVSSERPFGLYKVWSFYPLSFTTLAYPRLLKIDLRPDLEGEHQDGNSETGRKGEEDILNLAPCQGEEARKISWKHYARTGEILVKEGEEFSDALYRIRLDLPHDGEAKEQYLSRLASEMVYCYRNQIPFYFETQQRKWGPSSEAIHLAECLKVLGVC